MNYVVYVIVNPGIFLSTGKMCTQVTHATVASVLNSISETKYTSWRDHGQTMICLKPRTFYEYSSIKNRIQQRNRSYFPIYDREIETCFSIEMDDHDYLYEILKHVPLL